MALKVETYTQLADFTAQKITGSYQSWTDFLTTAARLYKYPYHEQLMIYAQRPEATACADYDLWNKRMGRYIRRGSQSIALIDYSGDTPKLKYVFDVADTGKRKRSRDPYLWEYRPEHEPVVSAALEEQFGIPLDGNFMEQLHQISGVKVTEYYLAHQQDILGIVDGSYLEQYHNYGKGVTFLNAATVSTTYTLLSRCGLNADANFDPEEFLPVFDFNTPQTVAALGSAVSEISEEVLRSIEVTIKRYEREKQSERSQNYERTDLHTQRGLLDSQSGPVPAGGKTLGQVREDAENVPSGASSGAVEQPDPVRETVPAPTGDRRGGKQPLGADDAGAHAVGGGDGSPESLRPHEVGRADEQSESPGGGSDPGGTDLRLTEEPPIQGEQVSFFPSEAEQIQQIAEAENVVDTSSAFSISQPVDTQAAIDDAIREWNGSVESKHAVVRYMKDHARDKDTAAWLRAEYGDNFPAFPVPAAGMDLPWQKVQRRIAQLIKENRFYTEEEQDHFDDIDPVAIREALAERGIVNGELVDPEKLDNDPFIQQVTADVEHTAAEEAPEEQSVRLTPEEELDRNPISIQINGQWQTFPNAAAAEKASHEEYKDNLRRNAQNFHITDDNLSAGGPKAKYQANIVAIKLLKELEAQGLQASPEQQEVLSRYVGWGGIPDAFDSSKPSWASEYEELKGLLTPEEYTAARASTLNAHYTSPTVIRAIYEAVGNMGFQTGNILEPAMGVGNFFGMLPEVMQSSRLYGVELDSVTGRIAQQLYPKANITVAGFETTDHRDFFDFAVGNVPFGQYKVNDPPYNKLGFNIHNYFFAKALDQIRPGGMMAFVTSRYTMDAKDSTVRRYLAQRAELLGAIRLPNNAFKANAGTEVVSDIIFLQKRDRPIEIDPDWVHLGQTDDGYAINSYFLDHPEMVMGRNSSESTAHGMDYTVEPLEDVPLADQLHEAVQHIQGSYHEAEIPDLGEGETIQNTLPADPDVKNFSYTLVDGEVYFRENSIMVRPELNSTAKERIKGMIALRTCVHELIDLQMDEAIPDSAIVEKQAELNRLYDSFSEKYGLINSRGNKLAFADDSAYYLLCALEIMDDEGNFQRKADMFTKRTIQPHRVVTSVDTASEALTLSIAEKATVDMTYMSNLTEKNWEELASELHGVIFHDPTLGSAEDGIGWVTADEYLSGNVRQKLRQAEAAAADDPSYQVNVEALRAAQPKDLDASEIEVRLGATWIDRSYIKQFMFETFDTPYYSRRFIDVQYSPYTAAWNITGKTKIFGHDVAATNTYGTDRVNAYEILEDSLNLRDVQVYDTIEDADGKKKRVLNSKETTLAAQKQQLIRDAFKDWIWKDPERRQALVHQYNEELNSTRPREYDGSHIVFAGMNPEITLREHQRNAIAHVLYGGNTLLAHEVGAGKTFEMVAAAMESKRLGLCQKSIFVVPNHLTEQWASEFLRLYPSANILVTKQRDFETKNRKKFCARIATGDYDAVIIGHSQFEKIPISQKRQERLLQDQISEITLGISEVKHNGGEKFTVKELERTKRSLEARLEKLQADHKKDDVVTFEELGVDRLFVDEAHNYKNMFLYTKMRNVAGLSTSDAQKSSDMFNKCRYMDELTGSRGVIFATGTPVSNSMTELYTMQRYLQYDRLSEMGMVHFDCWASRFGETVTALELAPEGKGYRPRTRFSRFFNLPELMNLFKEVADIKTADQLQLPVPEVEYHNVVAKPTEVQKGLVQELSERAAAIHTGSVDPSFDNMLKVTSDGRKLGLDQRIINPSFPDESGSKVNLCAENILKVWKDGEAGKLTQLVFCDISTPGKTIDMEVQDGVAVMSPFQNVYDDLKKKLITKGVPEEQIAFIHDANTEVKKKELFGKVRSGQVRVLLGSTSKMGAGTNVQDRLVAIHDLDCPWRPGDLAQRKGRIERQGNQNAKVHVFRYVTEGTFDAYLWVRHEVALINCSAKTEPAIPLAVA